MATETQMIEERVALTLHADGVAEVRLARPDKMNALDSAMFRAIIEAGARLAGLTSLRAVVLSGEGRAFCAGLDMGSMQELGSGGGGSTSAPGRSLLERAHGIANNAQQVAMAWRNLPVPVIAALHGVTLGGGLQVALGADMRLIAPECRLSIMEIKWGLVPDMAGMVTVRGLVRPDVLRELVLTGRVVSGEEAAAIGLATRVAADPLAEALALARQIAGKSPDAVRAAKRLLNLAQEADAAEILVAESQEQERLMGNPNQMEAVRANLEKREPNFRDPQAA
jgi:enoyl-CoA hydratase/carnithine racemase